ncbi:MAG: septal ring lytic transglycosylase RlpA family lipoprotein, partial [Bacteroidetes bacterium QH_1_64_81]
RVTRVDHAEAPSVVVRINDRGPFKRGRIIDLSKAAAQRIEMIREGVVEVRLEVVSYPEGDTASRAEASEQTRPNPGW